MAEIDTILAITTLWLFVFIYAIAASIDFGSGFWSIVYLKRNKSQATSIANRYLSPSWEVTNVFIVLIVVGLITFFPGATLPISHILLIPGSIILILLTLRSALLVFSHTVQHYHTILAFASGLCGICIPALLILILPISAGNDFVRSEPFHLDWWMLAKNPNMYAFIGLAVSSTLYLSALLLADYSLSAKHSDAYTIYRRDALLLAPLTFGCGLLTLATMKATSPWIYVQISEQQLLLILSSFFFFLAYVLLLWPKRRKTPLAGRPRMAVIFSVIQYLLASAAYGRAHLPYLIYPDVTIGSAFTHPSTFHALFIVYIVGFAILIPGFIWFWKLFMQDQSYTR